MNRNDLGYLCELLEVKDIIKKEGPLLRIPHGIEKLVIVGDIHGDGRTLDLLLEKYLMNNTSYSLLFLGDYGDRPPSSWQDKQTEVIRKLLKYKIQFPSRLFLLMGNHDLDPNKYVPFDSTFWSRLTEEEQQFYSDVLSLLPMVAITGNGVAFCHGTLPQSYDFTDFNMGRKRWIDAVWGDYHEVKDSLRRHYRPDLYEEDFNASMEAFNCNLLVKGHNPSAPLIMYGCRCITLQTTRHYEDVCGKHIVIVDLSKSIINDASDVEIIDIDTLNSCQETVMTIDEYRKEAEQGDAESQFCLGLMYMEGQGVQVDNQEACFWWEKAAANGHVSAQCNIGVMYEHGDGVVQSHSEAMKWYLLAAEQGDVTAQYNLGRLYEDSENIDQDYSIAREWYGKAAEQGDLDACYHLGLLYENEEWNEQDYEIAFEWYLRAAEMDHVAAQYNLAGLYEAGMGVDQDSQAAFKWYKMAAIRGDADAQLQLGNMYSEGNGIRKNPDKAKKWWEHAAGQGNEEAEAILRAQKRHKKNKETSTRKGITLVWIEKSFTQFDGGHGVRFYDSQKKGKHGLVAFMPGFEWMRVKNHIQEVFIRPADDVHDTDYLTKVRQEIQYYVLGNNGERVDLQLIEPLVCG